jgi:hypothetical protein
MKTNSRVRELYGDECLFDFQQLQKQFIFSQIAFVSFDIDLFSNEALLKDTIRCWLRLHPILRCCIVTEYDTNGVSHRYFETMHQSKLDPLTNVEFLSCSKEDWIQLYERELSISFDSSTGPLWRLKIVKLQLEKNNFAFLLTTHHGISDGKSAYSIINELCSIIEDSFKNNLVKELFIEYNEELNYRNDPRKPKGIDFTTKYPIDSTKCFRIPDFIKPSNDINKQTIKDNSFKPIYKLDGSLFLDLTGKIQQDYNSKIRCFTIDCETLAKLLQKTKQHGSKLTHTFTLVTIISLLKAFRDISNDKSFNTNINYSIPISLRQFLTPPLIDYVCGEWLARFHSLFITKEHHYDNFYLGEQFWIDLKCLNDCFYDRLKANEHFLSLENSMKFFRYIEKGNDPPHMTAFSLSNLGTMPSKFNANNEYNIYEYYSGISFKRNNKFCSTQHGILTIDEKLFWTISFDSSQVKEEFVDKLIEKIRETVRILVQD